MSALTARRARNQFKFQYVELTLTGAKAWANGRACFNGVGKVVPATSAPGLKSIGLFVMPPHGYVDATSADKTVTVDLEVERQGEYFANATSTDAVTASDIGKMAYMLDDQTVTITSTGRSPAGRIWEVSTTKGVLIEAMSVHERSLLGAPVLPAYASNTSSPTDIENGGVYDVPTTAANSSIVLPAAARDQTIAYFLADGTKNGHTITFKDETGTVSLNTATTASKRFLATAIKLGGKWAVAVTSAP